QQSRRGHAGSGRPDSCRGTARPRDLRAQVFRLPDRYPAHWTGLAARACRPMIPAATLRVAGAPLARAYYEERLLPAAELNPRRLAVLADALEEAGGTDKGILAHCRAPGPHVRGAGWLTCCSPRSSMTAEQGAAACCRSAVEGCMIGAIAGDVIGSVHEAA